MKKICTIILGGFLLAAVPAGAQTGLAGVLAEIEKNSKTLEAREKLTEARKLEAGTGRFLADPHVGFEHMWSKGEGRPTDYSVSVSQALDFPTAYLHRNRLSRLKQRNLDLEYAGFRQNLLLEARQTCIRLVYLYRRQAILDRQLADARQLCQVYGRRLEEGTANRIEENKVRLERLNLENRSRLNRTDIGAALKELENLNGGRPLAFADTVYTAINGLPFDRLFEEFLAADPVTGSLDGEQRIAEREVRLSRASSLPKMDLGYKHADSSVGEAADGITVGISIPLFEKRNTVRKSRAQAEYAGVLVEERRLALYTELKRLHEQAESYRTSMAGYAAVLEQRDHLPVLAKAREAGQISVIDYCLEVSSIYGSWLEYLELERDYHLTMSLLYRYRL